MSGATSGHAVPLTPVPERTAARRPAARPPGGGLGRAVRAGALLPALRAALPRHRAVRAPRSRCCSRSGRSPAFVAEVPSGALADRWSRRGVAGAGRRPAGGGVRRLDGGAAGFWAFALGFVVWGVGGALVSGASRGAGLRRAGRASARADSYVRVNGGMTAAELLVQVPDGVRRRRAVRRSAATRWSGWVSVGVCLAAAALALRFPEAPADGGRRATGRHPARRA